MKISNIRLGHATNSSSTHSIILDCPLEEFNTECGYYDWENFLLKSEKDKNSYFAALLFENLKVEISEEYARIIVRQLFSECILPEKLGIDHQSVVYLPRKYDDPRQIDLEFFREMLNYVQRNDVSIAGGNDNDEPYSYGGTESILNVLPKDDFSNELVCRKDKDYWIIFNKITGAKIRLSFNSDIPYECSTTPELIDVKITDFCPFGCCTVSKTKIKTPEGEVLIKDLKVGDKVYSFSSEQVEDEVLEIYKRYYQGEMIEVDIGSKIVFLTKDHRILTSNKGWLAAGSLNIGDQVFNNNNLAKVISIGKHQYADFVYNISTKQQNYYANGVLVHNCYCYQNSTLEGKHASLKNLREISYTLSSLNVFEVALGGGETTYHPDFAKILKIFASNNIVPNFTTFTMKWANDSEKEEAVLKYAGGFALSVNFSSHCYENLRLLRDWKRKHNPKKSISLQVILGINTDSSIHYLMETMVEQYGVNTITLLGYKSFGRGLTMAAPHKNNLNSIIKKAKTHNIRLGVDTKVLQDYSHEDISDLLKTKGEGKFSMYIDAVNGVISKDSYTEEVIKYNNLGESIKSNFPFNS